ncbi:uncharacterized protein LOC135399640 [Ornithodoros turicata]|uniref:uncharacterized protein LOC135399640 n=1 Tax=Ornithodoros turicata TaxID=34597 RepID=UPI003138B924
MAAPAKPPSPGKLPPATTAKPTAQPPVQPFGSLAAEVAAAAHNRSVGGTPGGNPVNAGSPAKPAAFPSKFPPPVSSNPAPAESPQKAAANAPAEPTKAFVPPAVKLLADITAKTPPAKPASPAANQPPAPPPPPQGQVSPPPAAPPPQDKVSPSPAAPPPQDQIPPPATAPPAPTTAPPQEEQSTPLPAGEEKPTSSEPAPVAEQPEHAEPAPHVVAEVVLKSAPGEEPPPPPPPPPPAPLPSVTSPSEAPGGKLQGQAELPINGMKSDSNSEEKTKKAKKKSHKKSTADIKTSINIYTNAGGSAAALSNVFPMRPPSMTMARQQESFSSSSMMPGTMQRQAVQVATPPPLPERKSSAAMSRLSSRSGVPISRANLIGPSGSGVQPMLMIPIPKRMPRPVSQTFRQDEGITMSQTVYQRTDQQQGFMNQVCLPNMQPAVPQQVEPPTNEMPRYLLCRVVRPNSPQMAAVLEQQGAVAVVPPAHEVNVDNAAAEPTESKTTVVAIKDGGPAVPVKIAPVPVNISAVPVKIPSSRSATVSASRAPDQIIRLEVLNITPGSNVSAVECLEEGVRGEGPLHVDVETEMDPPPAASNPKEGKTNQAQEQNPPATHPPPTAPNIAPVAGKSIVPDLNAKKTHAVVAAAVAGIVLLMLVVYIVSTPSHAHRLAHSSARSAVVYTPDVTEELVPREIGDSRQVYAFKKENQPYWNL